MINRRKPISKFYDRRIKHNAACYVLFLNEFYAWPIYRRRQVRSGRLSQPLLPAASNVPYYRILLADSGMVRGNHVAPLALSADAETHPRRTARRVRAPKERRSRATCLIQEQLPRNRPVRCSTLVANI
jgi:hypothetical protein